jgi:hypothetical protein
MKECESLNCLEEILSFDIVDQQFLWSQPQINAAQAALAAAANSNGNGFCELSGSPDR